MFVFIYHERETETWVKEQQRERDTESEAGSRFWAVITEPNTRLKLTNSEIVTWAKVRHLMDWATQVPLKALFKYSHWYYLHVNLSNSCFHSDQIYNQLTFINTCYFENRHYIRSFTNIISRLHSILPMKKLRLREIEEHGYGMATQPVNSGAGTQTHIC